MSTQQVGATRARASRPAPPRAPGLRVVPRSVAVRRGSAFVVLLATILVTGLVGLLLLNLSMQKGAFELAGLQARTSELQVQQQALDQRLERIQSTQNLARQATAQGMVPSTTPIFLDLSDGSIIGDPVPAAPGPTLAGVAAPAIEDGSDHRDAAQGDSGRGEVGRTEPRPRQGRQ